jgi:hypothetical protein
MATHEEIEEFFTCWGDIVRAAAGSEVCAAINAAFESEPVEVVDWSDWTWADEQARLEAVSREAENFARRIVGEPEIDAWEWANIRGRINAGNDAVREMIANGNVINLH